MVKGRTTVKTNTKSTTEVTKSTKTAKAGKKAVEKSKIARTKK
jgi:hypothetical protein